MGTNYSLGPRRISRLRRRTTALRRRARWFHDHLSEPTASTQRVPSCASQPSLRAFTPPTATGLDRGRHTLAQVGGGSVTQTATCTRRRGLVVFALIGLRSESTTEQSVSEHLCLLPALEVNAAVAFPSSYNLLSRRGLYPS